MTNLVRRLRGALGMGVTWGVLWSVIGLVPGVIVGVVSPDQIEPGVGPGRIAAVLGFAGLLSGLGFAGLFSIVERRRASARSVRLYRRSKQGAT
jgi:hypothetical protein